MHGDSFPYNLISCNTCYSYSEQLQILYSNKTSLNALRTLYNRTQTNKRWAPRQPLEQTNNILPRGYGYELTRWEKRRSFMHFEQKFPLLTINDFRIKSSDIKT